jgi:hypothetical protein
MTDQLAFSISLDPNVNPYTSFWTSFQAADLFWAAFAAIAVALVVVSLARSRNHRRQPRR